MKNILQIQANNPQVPEGISLPFNYITTSLTITNELAERGYHPGDCTEDVQRISDLPEIHEQLQKISPEELRKELYDYGAWDDEELNNHEKNLQRLLWIACGNIIDGNY